MVLDANGHSHKAAGRPDGGQYESQRGSGMDDDLPALTGHAARLDTPDPDELRALEGTLGADAAACMLELPDGSVAGCYTVDRVDGPLPAGWHAYDTMTDDYDDDDMDDKSPWLAIDDQPAAHVVDQGPKIVTRHDLTGLPEFDRDHYWGDGRNLGDDIALLEHGDEWRQAIADDCGIDPDDMDDEDIYREAARKYLMADAVRAAGDATRDPGRESLLLDAAHRLYADDMDRDFPVPFPRGEAGMYGVDATGLDGEYVMFDPDGEPVGLDAKRAGEVVWEHRTDILRAVGYDDRWPGDARLLHMRFRTDRDWTAWDSWQDPETVEAFH